MLSSSSNSSGGGGGGGAGSAGPSSGRTAAQTPSLSSSVSSDAASGPEKSTTRLYVGNLHPSVDEYSLIQVFSKHGKIAKLDYLFHKSGPQKGKPRGYAFIEFSSKEEAMQALAATNDKMLRGRKVSVTFANKSEYAEVGTGAGALGPHRHRHGEASKPTTLSLIKNAQKPKSTNAKIAAMEAKLKLLQEQRSSAGKSAGEGSQQQQLNRPPPSAGLPSKPPPSNPILVFESRALCEI
ncbi:hypothetical protein OC835_003561 [Tilletia horrida]|nr:hypothetical protein OC835_003561 [Tilletia horrida]